MPELCSFLTASTLGRLFFFVVVGLHKAKGVGFATFVPSPVQQNTPKHFKHPSFGLLVSVSGKHEAVSLPLVFVWPRGVLSESLDS